MKRTGLAFILALAVTAVAFAAGYEAEKTTGDYSIGISSDNKPAVVGDNEVGVEIKGRKGDHVKDADVEFYYYMPSMPSMNYTAKAELKDNGYRAVIKPTMPGKWTVDVRFRRPGEQLQKVSFNFAAK